MKKIFDVDSGSLNSSFLSLAQKKHWMSAKIVRKIKLSKLVLYFMDDTTFYSTYLFELKFLKIVFHVNSISSSAEMYDPEEACTEEAEKEKEDSKQNGDNAPDIVVKEEIKTEVKEEPVSASEEEVKPEQTTPGRPKRQAAAASNVKNGAGPKCKKAKK